MVITRTPLRVSLAGGGSDLPVFYRRQPGRVLSAAIDKYVYVALHRRFDATIRLSCGETERVASRECLAHPIVRECLRLFDLDTGLDIVSMVDVPGETGLGSSSSFAVGIIHALHALVGAPASAEDIAAQACHIEIDRLEQPIGKQDQYIAAYGGIRRIQFNSDESVAVAAIGDRRAGPDRLDAWLMLFYTGTTRHATDILRQQARDADRHQSTMARLAAIADEMVRSLERGGSPGDIGRLLHESWRFKRSLGGVTTPAIDDCYDRARRAGAIGGKLLGAGGGGFLLVCAEPDRQPQVRDALAELRHVPFAFEPRGSELLLNDTGASTSSLPALGTALLSEASR